MNSVDKDIEQFESNLVEINLMKEQISNLSESLKNIVSETKDINELKNFINTEISNLNNSKAAIEKQVNDEITHLKNISENIQKSVGHDNELIINPLANLINMRISFIESKINELNDNIEEKNKKTTKTFQKIFILLGICIFMLILNFALYIV